MAALAGTILFTGSLVGCSSAEGSTDPQASDVKLAAVTIFANDPNWITLQCSAEAAAKEAGVEIEWFAGQGQEQAEAQANFDAALLTDPDALLLLPPTVDGFTSQVESLHADGVPVFNMTTGVPAGYQTLGNDGDNAEFIDFITKDIGTTGKLAILGGVQGVPVLDARWTSLVDVLAEEAPDITVLPTEYDFFDRTQATTIVAALLTGHPDLTAIYAIGGPSAMGAVAALEEAGRTDVKVYAYDTTPEEVDALRDGKIRALLAAPSAAVGAAAVEAAVTYLDENPGRPAVTTTAAEELFPFAVVTQDNVDEPEIAPYLYVDSCE